MLNKLINKENLTYEEAYNLYNILKDESEIKISGYLCALQTKGYTSEEIAGFAKAMRDNALKVNLGNEICDTCGTGGDGSSTINVSTAVSILLSCFKKVAKHGNVSITSNSGSANVLDELGIKKDCTPEQCKEMIHKTNYVFLFAPNYHYSLKKIMPVRRELKIKTIFNILGPLANPANPDYQLIGVYSSDLVEKVGKALKLIGVKKGLVIYGNGLDELNPNEESIIYEINSNNNNKNDNNDNNENNLYTIHPKDLGITPSKPIPCSSATESAKRIINVFNGKINEDRDFILLNSAGALYSANIVNDFKDGYELAKQTIDEGKVVEKLKDIQKYSEILNKK